MELLERDAPLKMLADSLRDAAAGLGHVALVYGEAGIGKTAILERFMDEHRGKTRILLGRCDALFTPQPLGPLHDIALQTNGALLRLMQSADGRLAIFGALLDELRGAAAPTVLAFEDVHWADEATLDLLKYLGRRVRTTRTLMILTYRDDELDANHLLWSLLGNLPAEEVRRVQVQPLSAAAVADLARSAGRSAERVHAQTHGNPFYVTELLASPPDTVPATVREATLARTRRLSPQARETLELCSTVPNRVEAWLIGDAMSAPLDECIASGLMVEHDGMLAFRHELARRAVERALSPSRLRALHACVLRSLLERGAASVAVARLVHHAARAGDDAAVCRHAPQAAQQASVLGAHREAAAHYQTALDHTPAGDLDSRATLLESRAYECGLFDQLDDAAAARTMALDLRRQQGDLIKTGGNLSWLSRLAWMRGCGEEARKLAAQAVEVLEPLPPGRELAMAYSNMAQLHMRPEDGPTTTAWGQRALLLAEQLGQTDVLVHALINVGGAEMLMGNSAARMRLERSLDLALANELHEQAARAYTNLAFEAFLTRDYARAEQLLAAGLAYTRSRDLDSWTPYLMAIRSRTHLEQARWPEAEEDAIAALRGAHTITRLSGLFVLGCLRIRRGDGDARPPLDEARELAFATGDTVLMGPVAAIRAEAAWLEGDKQRVRAEAEAIHELALRHPEPHRRGELALWLWRAGALDRAPERTAPPYRLEIEGDWRGAAAAWQRIGCPYERALALAHGDETAQLEALAILGRLGAAPAAALIRRRLRTEGVRSIPHGPRAATKGNPLGLTGRQVEILRLLAENLSNKEIAAQLRLSPKTVDHHVGAILAKLDVATRKQAAAHPVAGALLAKTRESPAKPG
jgi:DNA-binding CsgD family transcriptional regulator